MYLMYYKESIRKYSYRVTCDESIGIKVGIQPPIRKGETSPTSTFILWPSEYQIEANKLPIMARKTTKL